MMKVVKEENFRHFMSAGATEKSLQLFIIIVSLRVW